MNDFTKKELTYILDNMINIIEIYPDSNIPYSIRDKIQSMIDNYCEHIWTDGSGNYLTCIKCHYIGGRK